MLIISEKSSLLEDGVNERSFAMVNVRNNADVPNLGGHRLKCTFLSLSRKNHNLG
jgi:hypothetical protein